MKSPKRILYVEDDQDIQTIVKLAIEAGSGSTVAICSSGAKALELVPAFQPDLILLDAMLPGMDGITILQQLRELPATKDVAVIFLTAKAQPSEIARFKDAGALGVITKPFDPLTLPHEIERLWEQRNG